MSKIPAAVDALVTFVGLVLPDLQNPDTGPEGWPDQDMIVVGWRPDQPGVTIDTTQEGLHGDDRERFDVWCHIYCVGGDLEIQPVRQRIFDHYTTVATRLKQNPTLGGVVLKARPSIAAMSPYKTPEGVVVDLAFTVACDAFA